MNLYTLISFTQVGPKGCSKEKPFSKNSEKKIITYKITQVPCKDFVKVFQESFKKPNGSH